MEWSRACRSILCGTASLLLVDAFSPAHAMTTRTGARVFVAENEVIDDSLSAFGADVHIEGTVKGDLLVAGANVIVAGRVEGNVRAFGAHVVLSGEVAGETALGGAYVTLSGRFGRVVRAWGAAVVASGAFADDLLAGGARLEATGTFEKSARLVAARVIVGPTAVVKGDLLYRSEDFQRMEGAHIQGAARAMTDEELRQMRRTALGRLVPRLARFAFWGAYAWWGISLVGLLILGAILHVVLPRPLDDVTQQVFHTPWRNLGVGLAVLIVGPIAIVIALITLVGIPLGVLGAIVYGLGLYLSKLVVGISLGTSIVRSVRKKTLPTFVWLMIIGVVILHVLRIVPFLGFLVTLVLLLFGLGAMFRVGWGYARGAPARA